MPFRRTLLNRDLAHRALWRVGAAALGAVAALVTATVASAQESGDTVGSDVASFGIGDWMNLGVRLALVVAVIWAAVHAMRWYVRRMNRGTSRNGLRALEVLETHVLGPNRTLHLVRLGDRAVLVGATQERITQLLTVDDPEEFQLLIDKPEDDEVLATSRGARAAGAMSLLDGLRTGISVMRARQAEMNERIRAERAAKQASAPADVEDDSAPRASARKGILGRSERVRRPSREMAPVEPVAEMAETRQSLFDRTLASIDALEVMPNGSTAAGPRARASYGAARTMPTARPTPRATAQNEQADTFEHSRDRQIAELQRAIAQARRSAS